MGVAALPVPATRTPRRRRPSAARAAADLRRLGVRVVGTGNAASPTGQASTLAYPPALAGQGRLLASVLGGQVKLVKAGDGASLVLTVGSGFRLR